MDWQKQKVLVIGAGVSGISAAALLAECGAEVTLADNKELDLWQSAAHLLAEQGVVLHGGGMPAVPADFTLAVISPGISPQVPVAEAFGRAGLPLWGELELAAQCAVSPFLAITGTNGKTTTTSLVGHILTQAGIDNYIGGNIGRPLASVVRGLSEKCLIVAEISSFQLETVCSFHPRVAAILNLTPDHLDRHGDFATYGRTKEQIFARQTEQDLLVLNYDDENTRDMAQRAPSKVIFYSCEQVLEAGICLLDEVIVWKEGASVTPLLPVCDLPIRGRHNVANAMAAAAICLGAGVSVAATAAGMASFQGVEHRQEVVATIDGITYINDSKGTNPDSTVQALLAYPQQVVILGGYDKHSEFDALVPLIKERARAVVLLGQTAAKIKATLLAAGYDAIYEAGTDFPLAVHKAAELAQSGDVVMLSPACASWDMFDNFEQRGEFFKRIVRQMID